jgi:hypothetical protein
VVIELGRDRDMREVQERKELLLRVVTEFGMETVVNLEQPEKVETPIFCTPEGIVIAVNEEQPEKRLFERLVSELDRLTLVKAVQS